MPRGHFSLHGIIRSIMVQHYLLLADHAALIFLTPTLGKKNPMKEFFLFTLQMTFGKMRVL